MKKKSIIIKGASQNNLKGFDCEIPLNALTVICGVSGSGKSSFAFDTLYAEGQRRYIETFSPYARQFMERMDKAMVKRIDGIPPAIAIKQGNPVRTSRSTVGTITELTDFTKLLFARIGELHCRQCQRIVTKDTSESIWERLLEEQAAGLNMIISFPCPDRIASPEILRRELLRDGFHRALLCDRIIDLEEAGLGESDILHMNIIVDMLSFQAQEQERIADSIEQGLRLGNGHLIVDIEGVKRLRFSSQLHCPYCDISYKGPAPNLFSFNSPLGACSNCKGFGRVIDIDMAQIIPDPSLSLRKGAIKVWGTDSHEYHDMMRFCQKRGIPLDMSFEALDTGDKLAIIDGAPGFYGIRGFFKWLEGKSYKMHVRVFLSRYRGYYTCPKCQGTRFKEEALLYRVKGLNIANVYALSIGEASDFFQGIDGYVSPDRGLDDASHMILREITNRLRYLKDVGLSYLTLNRQSRTLSGGEVERVSLTKALGSSLVNTLYVLDEPSVGLHARDSNRLMGILRGLACENSVVVVEHDPEIIAGADNLLDLGPGAGEAGGSIVYTGPVSDISRIKGSVTIDYLTGRQSIPVPGKRRMPKAGQYLIFRNCREHNLKNQTTKIPLGVIVCLTGVSGSGKSTLGKEIIYKGIMREKGLSYERPGAFDSVNGVDLVDTVHLVDQSPIGKTPRSNPVSYIGALSRIRNLFVNIPLSKERGYMPGHFSFNAPYGRCKVCQGNGYEKIEMQFLADVFVTCPECKGKRFKREILEVEYNGMSIADILEMTFSQGLKFFNDRPRITRLFDPLIEIGLGYLRLGQPINTLSGGEAQRLKIAKELNIKGGQRQLYIFDEPTTGLHFSDIKQLLKAFERLIEAGNTLLVIEHNPDVIKCADYIIDLGPEGGDDGGKIVAEGTPEEIIQTRGSHTGRFLKRYIECKAPIEILSSNAPSNTSNVSGPEKNPNSIIHISGAREHNLKNLEITIPRNQLVVITGISGSGKSSLAFDVLFAEGQRRYIESLSTYVRQYINIMERADVDIITGISPTVAIEQRMSLLLRRSTVASTTEIYHYLRLLFSKLGIQYCRCNKPLSQQKQAQMLKRLMHNFKSKEVLLLVPKVIRRKGTYKAMFEQALKRGYKRARIDGVLMDLIKQPVLERYQEHTIEIVTGQIRIRQKNRSAVSRMITEALKEGNGFFYAVDTETGQEESFSQRGYCPDCGIGIELIDPRLFSFNSKYGACLRCDGLGILNDAGKVCDLCKGKRLNERALSIRIAGMDIADVTAMSIHDASKFLPTLPFSKWEKAIADLIVPEIMARLEFLDRVGLSYLTLNRSGNSLSGGETQRIRLSAQLGANLTGICYILDEPTIGLHPRDNTMLINTLKTLKYKGNSVIIVEHDEDTIRMADHIIDLGPGAGVHGGEVIAQGPPAFIKNNPASVTGRWIFSKEKQGLTPRKRMARGGNWLSVSGASKFNLKGIDIKIPLGTLVCITGVSGSGKSTLVMEVIYKGIKALLNREEMPQGICRSIEGWEHLERILEVDHSPIGKTPRSTPGTYIGFHDEIRRLLAQIPEARIRGYKSGRFSFNIKGGRCEACKGQGRVRIEMSFLPEVYINCEVCQGKRFNEETLTVKYKEKSIADILDMTIEEGLGIFNKIPKIEKPLKLLKDMGLGYLNIGQPSNTLSGGEAQRIKLAYELNKATHGKTLYILDEPTTGLHLQDIEKLINVLQRLVDVGNTLLIIEHNLEVIKEADYIIDLGPEGGDGGGEIVAHGTPENILKKADVSYTARYLKKYLDR